MSAIGLFLFCFVYYLLAGVCISVGYHRSLSHRALELKKWVERAFVTFGLGAGTPVQWVGSHRFHHSHSDEEGDPHSPHLGGFWHAHVGWYIGTRNPFLCFLYAAAGPSRTLFDGWHRPRSDQEHNHLARDVESDPYYRFLSRPAPYFIVIWLQILSIFGFCWWVWGWAGVGALWLTYAFIYNAGDSAGSFAHLVGDRPFESSHRATNNRFVGYFAAGEWHANHHAFPNSAKHGLFKNQFDLAWQAIRLLEKAGLAKNPHVPDAAQIEAKRKK